MSENTIVKGKSKDNSFEKYNNLIVNPDGSIDSKILTNGGDVSVQNPFPCDGDSVYAKDVWVDESSTTGWVDVDSTGDNVAVIPFNNLHTHILNSTSDNPKVLLIHFKRTIPAHQIGFGCYEGVDSFSNIKIELLGSSGEVRRTVDDSSNDTKYNSKNYDFEPALFNAIRVYFYTDDEVCISNITIQKSINTDASLKAKSSFSDKVEPITSYNGALEVDAALVHENGVNLFFFRELDGSTTIDAGVDVNDTSVQVVDATPFAVGDKIRLTTDIDVGQSFLTITDIDGNTITVDRPISSPISEGAPVQKVGTLINAEAGTLDNPVIYRIEPPNSTLALRWQLTRMLITIADEDRMDDGRFGGIPQLTNGVNFRLIKGDGTYRDIANWKDNGDMAEDMYDIDYTTKAPSGEYGLRGRWAFTKAEFIIDLDGAQGDYFELRVQDDITDLSEFEIKCQGRLFGE